MDQFDLSGLNAQLEKTVRLLSQAERSSSHIATNLSSGGAGSGGATGGTFSGGSGNILRNSLGTISTTNGALGSAFQGAGALASAFTGNPAFSMLGSALGTGANWARQTGANVAGSYLNRMSGLQGASIARSTSYYNAVIGQGGGQGMNARMQSATLGAFKGGGLSYSGADADVAGYLSQRGMVFNGAAGSTYMQTVNSVAGAGKYLNMDNMAATRAFEGMTSGSMSQNLMSMGINTSDPNSGKALKTSDIFEQVYSRMTAGRRKATKDETLESLRRGYLGASLNNMGFSEEQKQLFQQFAIAKSEGKTLDFSNKEQMSALAAGQTAQGNTNPQAALQSLAFEETRLMKTAADAFIQGMNDAVPAVTAMTTAMVNFTKLGGDALLRLDTALETFGGSTAGKMTNDVLNFQSEKFNSTPVGTVISNLFNSVVGDIAGFAATGASIVSLFQTMTGGGPGNQGTTGTGGADGAGVTAGGTGSFSFGRPVSGKVNSPYGPRKHPITGENKTHRGVDLNGRTGDAVYCAADGVVTKIGHNMNKKSGYGNNVTVDHENGYETLYAHLSKVSVSEGQRVKKGDKLGEVGETGAATAPHLHWEVRKGGSTIDPMSVVGATLQGPGNTKTPATDSRPAWMQAGAELVSGRSGSGYLPADQSAATATPTPSSIGARPSAGSSSSQPGMGGGSELLTLSKSALLMDFSELQTRYLGKGGTNKSTKSANGANGSGANVTINVTVAQATPAEAKKLAEMVKEYIADDDHIGMMRRR
jgi:murein DD-endopeptidase MepM/ murein hydrolase activator NlpD